jgi:hypothetical protein
METGIPNEKVHLYNFSPVICVNYYDLFQMLSESTGGKMSYEISWYIPEHVLFVRLTGELDLNDMTAMALDIKMMLQQGSAPVHVIVDDTLGGEPPKSLRELKARMEIVQNTGLGWVVAIGEGEVNPTAKFLVPLITNIKRINFVRRPTLGDAIQFLVKRDSRLKS